MSARPGPGGGYRATGIPTAISLILIASCRGRGGWRTLRRFRRWEARMFRSPRLLYLLSLAFKFTSAPGRILISRSQSA